MQNIRYDQDIIDIVTKAIRFCRESGLEIDDVIILVKALWGEWSACKRKKMLHPKGIKRVSTSNCEELSKLRVNPIEYMKQFEDLAK